MSRPGYSLSSILLLTMVIAILLGAVRWGVVADQSLRDHESIVGLAGFLGLVVGPLFGLVFASGPEKRITRVLIGLLGGTLFGIVAGVLAVLPASLLALVVSSLILVAIGLAVQFLHWRGQSLR